MSRHTREVETRVTVSVDPDLPIEERLELLSWAMAESLQGATLKWIERWAICDGEIEFVKVSRQGIKVPRGEYVVRMESVARRSGDGGDRVARISEHRAA